MQNRPQKQSRSPSMVYNRKFAANELSGLQQICGCIRNPAPQQPPRERFPRSQSSPPLQTGIQPQICRTGAHRIAANLRLYTNPRSQRPTWVRRHAARTSRHPSSLQRKSAALGRGRESAGTRRERSRLSAHHSPRSAESSLRDRGDGRQPLPQVQNLYT